MDPFRNYDAWLERPYQEREARSAEIEAAYRLRGLDDEGDLQPPHKPGDACPHCGEAKSLDLDGGADDPQLYCTNCDRDVGIDDEPSWDPEGWLREEREAAEEYAAEARAETEYDYDYDWSQR